MAKLGYIAEDVSNWKGWWIYFGSYHIFLNRWLRFRKTFEINGSVSSAVIKISAETRYWLFVNGKRVSRGPAKGYPSTQPYDTVDIQKHLRPGKNVLAVLTNIYGVSSFSSIWRNSAGFILDGSVFLENNQEVELKTDSTWKAIEDPARSNSGARVSWHLGFQEIFDARKDLPEWKNINYNDSAWSKPKQLGRAGLPPWHNMEARGTHLLSEEYVNYSGSAIFLAGKNPVDWEDEKKLKATHLKEKRKVIKEGKIKTVRDSLGNITGLKVEKTKKGAFSAVVLDLGRSSVGCPHFKIKAKKSGAVIDIFHTMRSFKDKSFMYKDDLYSEMAPFHRYTCREGEQEYELAHFQGARYIMLTFRNIETPLELEYIDYNFVGYPVEYKGSFESSDPLLNKIWETGRWTMRCCMLDSYVDCPDREQGQWMGDALVEEEVNYYTFGDNLLMRRMLRQCAQSQQPSGLLYGVFPSEKPSVILPDYNFTWLVACEKYYFYSGDKSLLAEIYPTAVKNLAWFEKFAGKDGLLGNPEGYWLFLDWAPIDKTGYTASFNLWWLHGLDSMIYICKVLGVSFAKYEKQRTALKKLLLKTFYDKKAGVWYEAYFPKTKKRAQLSQQANALAFLAGLPAGKGSSSILYKDFTAPKVEKKAYSAPTASTYFAQYVLDSLFKKGKEERAVQLIKKGWGSMIKRGFSTYLENWDTGSVCHAWSAHPVTMLSKYVLGVKCTGTGWSKIEFDPKPVKGLKWAKGVVPTPFGEISAEWKLNKKGKLEYSINYPKEIKCMKLPKGARYI